MEELELIIMGFVGSQTPTKAELTFIRRIITKNQTSKSIEIKQRVNTLKELLLKKGGGGGGPSAKIESWKIIYDWSQQAFDDAFHKRKTYLSMIENSSKKRPSPPERKASKKLKPTTTSEEK